MLITSVDYNNMYSVNIELYYIYYILLYIYNF